MEQIINEQMTYKEAMDYMESVNQYGSVLGLENIQELLKRLGNPEDTLSFIHIAGTNGKGSVGAYLSSILVKAGYLVGRYISPVLFEYRERIQIIGNSGIPVYISEENTARHLSRIKKEIEDMIKEGKVHPTPFEIETAMAFLEYAEKKCDFVVLEVGMGGRLDSTNIIKTTKCTVLTSISMDHMGILGDTIEKITYEKTGIMRKNVPVISSIQKEEVKDVIKKQAKEKNAPLIWVEENSIKDITYSLEKTVFSYQNRGMKTAEEISTFLLGECQPWNAAAAIEAALSLKEAGSEITWEHIKRGVQTAVWHGRFEIVHQNPIVIVDGAHNEGAALSLRKSIDFYFKGKRIFAILGIFADKEYDKILRITLDCVEKVFAIEPQNNRSLASSQLTDAARKHCRQAVDAKTVKNAMNMALGEANKEDIILVYGSLSYLHEVYHYFDKKEKKGK